MRPFNFGVANSMFVTLLLFIASALISIMSAACIIEIILKTLARWHIYSKAGVESWKSLIPFYNVYQDVKLAWNENWALVYILSSIGVGILSAISLTGSVLFTVLAVLGSIFILVIHIIYCVKLSRAFGHGSGWAVGLIFLEVVFMLMIGLGKSPYVKCMQQATDKTEAEETPQAPQV